ACAPALSCPDGDADAQVHPGFDSRIVSTTLDDALRQGARILGISGLQGSGKSTFAAQLAAHARSRGLQCAVLSIDDVYLGHADRQRLAGEVHPLLATRGPPGTHEVTLAIDMLDALRAGRGAALPRFDKLADGRWRRWCNHALARDYPALWQLIDRLLLLLPPSFGIVPEWRWQAEQGLRDASGDASAGMD